MTQNQGKLFTYTHHNGKLIGWVELTCQTDFAARTDSFNGRGDALAMHVASSEAETLEDLLAEEFIVSQYGTVSDLVKQLAEELGEEVSITRFFYTNFGDE